MKRKLVNLLVFSFLLSVMFSCGNTVEDKTTDENGSRENDTTTAKKEVVVEQKEIDFSKFDHYATILTKKDLVETFGKENLKDEIALYAEGTVEKKSTVLRNPKNAHIVTFVWKDDSSDTEWIEAGAFVYDENDEATVRQKIEAENGLFIGMPLLELKKWNGKDIKFSGFGWDYGGAIFIDDGSKLSKSPVSISLGMDSDEAIDFVMGDVGLNTNDSRLEKLDIFVATFTIHISK